MKASTSYSCNKDPAVCVFPDSFCGNWQQCRNCFSKFSRLLTNSRPQELNSFAPSGWDSPPLADCDSLSTQQLSFVECDLDIAEL